MIFNKYTSNIVVVFELSKVLQVAYFIRSCALSTLNVTNVAKHLTLISL